IEGFTGSGAGSHNGDGAGNPLNGVAELIAPILERFTGKPVDDAALQAAVAAALEAQRAKESTPRGEAPAGKREPLEATGSASPHPEPSPALPGPPASSPMDRRK